MNLEPVGWVRSPRTEPEEDGWDAVTSTITLDASSYSPVTFVGIDGFSHLEIVYLFDQVDAHADTLVARHSRDDPAWPETGVFAQRGTARPNRIGTSVCRLLHVEGITLTVSGLDALDGSPVLDIKPYVAELGPRGPVRQPEWTHDMLAAYWEAAP